MRSGRVSTAPPATTAFCLATLSKICCGRQTPRVASLAWLNSMKIFSRPLADDVDLVDVGHPQQALADVLGARLEVGEAEPVGAEHVERRIDVAVLVVEVRADDAGRQVAADVADLLAHLVPEVLDLARAGSWSLSCTRMKATPGCE